MPRATLPAILRGEGESVSATTTERYIQKPTWAREVQVIAVTEARLQVSPILQSAIKFIASTGVYSNVTANLVDNLASSIVELDSMVFDADYLYLFSDQKFNHLYINVAAVNATATSVMTSEYRKNDATWAANSLTDGTVSGGIALAQAGAVSWTSPGDEGKISPFAVSGAGSNTPMYAIRLTPSVASFDSNVTVAGLTLGPDHTNDMYLPAATPMSYNVERAGGLVISHSTAGIVRVNWLEYDGE